MPQLKATDKTVSVIIVNWNSGELLLECLSRLSKQTYKANEIILVDNNSSDSSISLIPESLLGNIKLCKLETNLGFAAANNLAIKNCNSHYVALLNPDAFPKENWLEELLIAANENPTVGSFGSKQICYPDSTKLDGVGDVYHASGIAWRAYHGKENSVENQYHRYIFSPCAGAALYNRLAFLEAGGFDEDFFCYMEDVDLGFRLQLLKYDSLFVDSAVVYHVGGGTSGGKHSDFSVYYGHRNLVWVYLKNMPHILLLVTLPLHLLMTCVAFVKFLLLGQANIFLRAKIDALKEIGKTLKKRKLVQATKRRKTKEILKLISFGFK
ncbi:glycosyltransferase family 2 protein [Vibrio sonorensis]|uniref:glycosyltransferase family 2 protein n=1 Tax=Vibrio sonorensis TaxID=1004316 RepID=UPI0008DA7E2D|nr:glycosyltransferase family 2 protein [Vibrio sonorensis]